MAAKNINVTSVNKGSMTTLYDNGRLEKQSYNDYKTLRQVKTSTYVNNKKLRPVSPYTMQNESWTWLPGRRIGRKFTGNKASSYTQTIEGISAEFYPARPFISDASRSKAINQALSRFKDGGSNIPLIFAEGGQTMSMINSRLKTIAKFALWAKFGKNFRKYTGRKLPKDRTENQIQNLWLELQWGWKPAMQDLYGLLSAYCGNLAWAEVRAIGISKEVLDGVENLNPYSYYGTYYYRNGSHPGVSFTHHQKKQYRCVIKGILKNAIAAQAAALGFSNPASLVWELIPYSCVIDYLLPIGEFVSALDATNGYDFKEGCMSHTTIWEFDCTVDHLIGTQDMTSNWTLTESAHSCKFIQFSREVLTSFPLPSLRIQNPFSAPHVANSLALLTQVFRNRSGSRIQA